MMSDSEPFSMNSRMMYRWLRVGKRCGWETSSGYEQSGTESEQAEAVASGESWRKDGSEERRSL